MASAGRYRISLTAIGIAISTIFVAAYTWYGRDPRHTRISIDQQVPGATPAATHAEGRVVSYPGAMIVVRTEIGGRLVSLGAHEQQSVQHGEVLATIAADEAQASLAEAKAQIDAADADTAWLTAELRRTNSLAETGNASRQTTDRIAHDLAAAHAKRALAEATAHRLEVTLAKTRIVAPLGGTITAQAAESGEVVAAGAPLVTIVDLTRRRIEAEVDEYDANYIHFGDRVMITAEGYGTQVWEGKVESIPDLIVPRQLKPQDPGRLSDALVLLVKVTLPPDAPLKIGQRVELAFQPR